MQPDDRARILSRYTRLSSAPATGFYANSLPTFRQMQCSAHSCMSPGFHPPRSRWFSASSALTRASALPARRSALSARLRSSLRCASAAARASVSSMRAPRSSRRPSRSPSARAARPRTWRYAAPSPGRARPAVLSNFYIGPRLLRGTAILPWAVTPHSVWA